MHVIDVAIDDQSVDANLQLPSAEAVRGWVLHALSVAEQGPAYEIAVRVVGSDEITSLNQSFRQRDKATNVLSFPADRIIGLPAGEACFLGDIAVCATVVAAEALAQGKPLHNHWAHMMIHGTLHLLGYDHETDTEAEAMEGTEIRLLDALGIDNPYIA